MKKKPVIDTEGSSTKKGYNEKNPGQPEGAFPPAANNQKKKDKLKSNTADKKAKEDED